MRAPGRAHPELLGRVLRAMPAVLLALVIMGLARAPDVIGVDPSPEPVVGGPVDPRSDGEGPGLAGEPLVILAGVFLLGVIAAGGTLAYVRLTRED